MLEGGFWDSHDRVLEYQKRCEFLQLTKHKIELLTDMAGYEISV